MVLQGLANFFRESRGYARHSIDGMRAEALALMHQTGRTLKIQDCL